MNAADSPLKTFRLGIPSMDATHDEFIDLVNRLNACDTPGFAALFPQLLEHTKAHFATEIELMTQCGFPATAEHQGEHDRVLGDLTRFAGHLQGARIRLARAYVQEQLPGWFKLHLITMDSALAAYLSEMKPNAGSL